MTRETIDTADAAVILGRSAYTVARWVRIGKLTPTGKLKGPRGAYLFDKAQVERLAAKLRANGS